MNISIYYSHIALGIKFDLAIKKVICANLVGPKSSMLHNIGLLFPEKILKGFYLIWAWWPSWSCDQEHLCKFFSPTLRSLHIKFELNWLSGFRDDA